MPQSLKRSVCASKQQIVTVFVCACLPKLIWGRASSPLSSIAYVSPMSLCHWQPLLAIHCVHSLKTICYRPSALITSHFIITIAICVCVMPIAGVSKNITTSIVVSVFLAQFPRWHDTTLNSRWPFRFIWLRPHYHHNYRILDLRAHLITISLILLNRHNLFVGWFVFVCGNMHNMADTGYSHRLWSLVSFERSGNNQLISAGQQHCLILFSACS